VSPAVDEALLEAARVEGDEDVLVLGGGSLALGAQKRLRDGWVYVVRHEVDELEELLREAHAVGATGLAYLVGEAPVLPLPDDAVAAAVGRVPVEDGAPAFAAVELARVLAARGRVALAEPGRPAGDAIAAALESAGFDAVTRAYVGDEVIVTGTRRGG
jgi:ubiquinone/menaquinone biosynthesis C-methylase UbiE